MRNAAIFERQMSYARKIVREVNAYDNFYFEICNEPFGNQAGGHVSVGEVEAWSNAIRGVIREEEAALPKRHLVFQVPVERFRGDSALDILADDPDVDAINMHDYQQLTFRGRPLPPLGRFMQRDLKLDRIHDLWTTGHAAGKPIVFDEDNACTNGLDEEAWTIHRKRAWTVVCSGGHYDMIDFSIQAGGGEDGTPASRAHIRSWLKHLSTFIHGTDFVHMTPARDFCTAPPTHTLAAALANPGKEYVIYLADKREKEDPGCGEPCSGELRFALPPGNYAARFFQPATGSFIGAPHKLTGGETTLFAEPFTHDVAIHIRAI